MDWVGTEPNHPSHTRLKQSRILFAYLHLYSAGKVYDRAAVGLGPE